MRKPFPGAIEESVGGARSWEDSGSQQKKQVRNPYPRTVHEVGNPVPKNASASQDTADFLPTQKNSAPGCGTYAHSQTEC
mmetsp:Transcript_93664/g.303248  ORF Transcript_93664/g.303248 Transcript_93664/m.303248 type:complete len:80 (-) Transcript_93664:375-614(-)